MKTAARRQLVIAVGSIFGAGFIHNLLPPIDIWIRSALTGIAAASIACLLNLLRRIHPGIKRFLMRAAE